MYMAIVPENPNYKTQTGQTIFSFVERVAGGALAPKITGMLIDLPIEEIQKYVVNFDLFVQRMHQAQ
jgi:hypothetical protein